MSHGMVMCLQVLGHPIGQCIQFSLSVFHGPCPCIFPGDGASLGNATMANFDSQCGAPILGNATIANFLMSIFDTGRHAQPQNWQRLRVATLATRSIHQCRGHETEDTCTAGRLHRRKTWGFCCRLHRRGGWLGAGPRILSMKLSDCLPACVSVMHSFVYMCFCTLECSTHVRSSFFETF